MIATTKRRHRTNAVATTARTVVLLGGTRCVLVFDHLLWFIGDAVVNPLERRLGCEEVMFLEERTSLVGKPVELPGISLPAIVIVECDRFDDPRVDQLLDMLIHGCVADARIELLEFVHRGQLLGMLEDVRDEREPRLLGDEMDQLTGLHSSGSPMLRTH